MAQFMLSYKLPVTLIKALSTTVGVVGLMLVIIGGRGVHASPASTGPTASGNVKYVVNSEDVARALILQPNGKTIVAGSSWSSTSRSNDFALVRYNLDGSLDASFGTRGKVTTDVDASEDEARALILQPDGKIVVVGYWWNKAAELRNFALARYAADGKLDPSFGTGGKVIATAGSGDDYIHTLALQPDGKIVVAGSFSQGPSSNSVLFRYNPDGTSDANFGKGGRRLLPRSGVSALIIEASGKIVVAGPSLKEDDSSFTLTRYNSDGSLDSAFNAASIVTIPINTGGETAVAVQPDGKVIVVGTSENRFGVRRYNPGGSLDTNFGIGGQAIATLPLATFGETAYALALQGDGKIVVAGHFARGEFDYYFALARYNSDGRLDTSFGTGGMVITSAGADGRATAVALQADGKIVMAGSASKRTGFDQGIDSDFALARYNPDGTSDPSFGSGSMVTTNFYSVSLDPDRCSDAITPPRSGMLSGGRRVGLLFFNDEATALTVQPDDKIVVAGNSNNGPSYRDTTILLRYYADGSRDSSFGMGGTIGTNGTIDEVSALALQTDGKLLAAGQVTVPPTASSQTTLHMSGPAISMDPSGRALQYSRRSSGPSHHGSLGFALVRYNLDGNLDMSFGAGGTVTTDFGPEDDMIHALALQNDSKIIVAGNVGADSASKLILARYHPAGILDASFGSGGKVVIPLVGSSTRIHAMALQEDGKLVIVGSSDQHLVLVRYHLDGSPDISFGTDGKVVTLLNSGQSSDKKVFSLALQSDGRITVAGAFAGGLSLVHYDAQGHLDSSFGKDGMVTTAIDTSASVVRTLAFQQDHKIIVGGSCSNGLGSILALFRYNLDGRLDTSFGKDGKVTIRIGEGSILS